jgi:tRNA A-37 threonylcarbamoyl transferase component Bud32
MSNVDAPPADPTDSDERRLSQLFDLWLTGRVAGAAPMPEELCPDDGTLKLRRQIAVRQAVAELGMIPGATLVAPAAGGSGATGAAAASGRYRLGDLIARGGMGAVYAAQDTVLGRDVAVKVLLDKFRDDAPTAGRFVEEARITGQLQHPGIPPVHDLGILPDGRPFLAMKLIGGNTLADLLGRRADPSADRGRFLAAFEAICQAVAYAHANEVVHRDLKPSNVMVGAFGEVQVMDWGLAKDLRAPVQGTHDAEPETDADPTATSEPGSGDPRLSQTCPGAVLGTPAYMPPEQARGESARADPRSDVFGLGAILCAILTGNPPYGAAGSQDVVGAAARGDLDEAFARLGQCGAEPELIDLCRRCLSPDPDGRPTDAGAVAAAVAGLRAASEERARAAERNEAEAKVRAAEERKRRRGLLAAAAVVVGVLLAGAGVSTWQAVRAGRALDRARTASEARDAAILRQKQITKEYIEFLAAHRDLTEEQKERLFADFVRAHPEYDPRELREAFQLSLPPSPFTSGVAGVGQSSMSGVTTFGD